MSQRDMIRLLVRVTSLMVHQQHMLSFATTTTLSLNSKSAVGRRRLGTWPARLFTMTRTCCDLARDFVPCEQEHRVDDTLQTRPWNVLAYSKNEGTVSAP